MTVLLVSLAVMGVMMSMAMPVWKQMAQREKEAELIFRGEQYKRAIGLYQRRAGPGTLPPNLDLLVEGRFLRKKYKDPITGGDFVPLRQGAAVALGGQPGPPQPEGRGQAPPGGRGLAPGRGGVAPQGGAAGGITGVASSSTDESIRIYNGRTRYNEWEFVFVQQTPQPGAGRGGPGPGGPGLGASPGPGGPGFPGFGPGAGRGRGDGRGGRGADDRGTPRGFGPGGFPPGFPSDGGRGPGTPQQPSRPPGR
jgi:type II secretory pathway pseudopilin PulG